VNHREAAGCKFVVVNSTRGALLPPTFRISDSSLLMTHEVGARPANQCIFSVRAALFLFRLRDWAERALSVTGIHFVRLDAAAAAESTLLPGEPHGDPADSILIATARTCGAGLLALRVTACWFQRADEVACPKT
jgi:hypothetical protein